MRPRALAPMARAIGMFGKLRISRWLIGAAMPAALRRRGRAPNRLVVTHYNGTATTAINSVGASGPLIFSTIALLQAIIGEVTCRTCTYVQLRLKKF